MVTLGKLTKLKHLPAAKHGDESGAAMQSEDVIKGVVRAMPQVGDRFWMQEASVFGGDVDKPLNYFASSAVVSVYHNDTSEGQDKLVLPTDFPDRELLALPELKNGDYLFATQNSVYHLEIRDVAVKSMGD